MKNHYNVSTRWINPKPSILMHINITDSWDFGDTELHNL